MIAIHRDSVYGRGVWSPSLSRIGKRTRESVNAETCCSLSTGRRGWWSGAGGFAGSGTLLLLLPKCPACIGAYLALWTGIGIAVPAAIWVRPALGVMLAASSILLAARFFSARRHNRYR